MSEARSITNLIGNGVATLAIARWEGSLDIARVGRILDGEPTEGKSDLVGSDSERPVAHSTA